MQFFYAFLAITAILKFSSITYMKIFVWVQQISVAQFQKYVTPKNYPEPIKNENQFYKPRY